MLKYIARWLTRRYLTRRLRHHFIGRLLKSERYIDKDDASGLRTITDVVVGYDCHHVDLHLDGGHLIQRAYITGRDVAAPYGASFELTAELSLYSVGVQLISGELTH